MSHETSQPSTYQQPTNQRAGSVRTLLEAKIALFAKENVDFIRPISFASVETKKVIGTSLLLAKGSPYTKILNK